MAKEIHCSQCGGPEPARIGKSAENRLDCRPYSAIYRTNDNGHAVGLSFQMSERID
ncbi:MAG: hypothetical protein ACYS6W_00475 [Planctomycetota bacterium]|jgi:hypothetical protein